MDMLSIGAALALGNGGAAAAAAEAANKAAKDASDAAKDAGDAATAADAAAAGYPNLDKDAVIDRTAFNFALMTFQAELRDVQARLATAEAKLTALT